MKERYMYSYLKTKPVWMQLLLFLGMAMGIWMILSLITGAIVSGMTGISLLELDNIKNWDHSNIENKVTVLRALQLAQFLGLFLIPSLLFAYFSDPKPGKYLGLNKPSNSIYWILGISAMILATPLVEYLGMINQKIVFGPDMLKWIQNREDEAMKLIQIMLSKHTPVELAKNLILIAVFAAVGEELFFRGILQRMFIKVFKNPWAGILLTAFIFSAVHMQFLGFIPRFALGALLGSIYWYSGSLWTSIAAHLLYNASQLILAYIRPELATDINADIISPSQIAITASGSTIIVGLIVWQMIRCSRTTYTEVYKNDNPQPQDLTFD